MYQLFIPAISLGDKFTEDLLGKHKYSCISGVYVLCDIKSSQL